MAFADLKAVGVPLATTLAIQAFVSMAAVAVPILAPAIAADLGVAPTELGVFVGLIFLAAMASSASSGDLILRFGAIRTSQVCLVLSALGLAAAAWAWLPLFALGAVLIGMAYGPLNPASSHILARTTPRSLMSLTFSLKQTGVPLGAALAGAVVPQVEKWAGWEAAVLAVAAACALVAALSQFLRQALDDDRQPRRHLSYRSMIEPLAMLARSRSLTHLAVASAIFMAIQLCLVTYLVSYLTGELGMSLVTAGLAMSAAQAAGIVGRIVWGAVADRFVRPRLLLALLGIGMALGAAVTSVLQAGWPYGIVVIPVAVFGATAIGWNGVYLAEVARLSPAGQVGVITGASMCITYLGVVIGPAAFGALADRLGTFTTAFQVAALVAAACAVVLVMSLRIERRETLNPTS